MKRHLRWLVGWGVLTALMVLAALRLEWREAVGALAAASPGWLLLAVAANALIRLVVLDGAVPGLAAVRPSPPRWWQMLAAAGAGLLFVGTLAFMALAPLISRRWPGILGAAFPAPVSAPTRD